MATVNSRVLFLLSMLCWLFDSSTAALIELSQAPTQPQALLTESLKLKCILTDTGPNPGDDVSMITSMVMSKDGIDLAVMSENTPPKLLVGEEDLANKDSLIVTGGINYTSVQKSHLEMSWQLPTTDQSGDYTCTVLALDNIGRKLTFTTSIHVVVTEPSNSEMVHYIRSLQMKEKELQHSNNLTSAALLQLQNVLLEMDKKSDQTSKTLADLQQTCQYQVQKNTQTLADIQKQVSSQHHNSSSNVRINNAQDLKIAQLDLQLQSMQHIESDVVSCGTAWDWKGHNMDVDGYSYRYKYVTVKFRQPYATPPVVHLGLGGGKFQNNEYAWFFIQISKITQTEFTIRCSIADLANQHLHGVRMNWLSLPH